MDHLIPRSKGGSSHWSNILTACADCNLGKSDGEIGLPVGVELTEPEGWRGGRLAGRRRRTSQPVLAYRQEPLASGSLGWCVDSCEACTRLSFRGFHSQFPDACFAVRPLSLKSGPNDSFVMEYRCACGPEWLCSWDREFAFVHSKQSRAEIEGRLPYHTPA